MRKILLFFCVFALITTLFSFTSVAATSGKIGHCTWELQGATLTIKGNGSTGNVSNPPWGTEIRRLYVEEGVTSLGNNLFRGCDYLNEVSLPSTLTGIGEKTFEYCNSLKSISFPEGLKFIGTSAFQQCKQLQEVYISSTVTNIGYMAFMS